MKRRIIVFAGITGLLTLLVAQSAFGFMFRNTFVPDGNLYFDGRVAMITAEIECTAGETVRVEATLTQGETRAIGRGVSRALCEGEGEHNTVFIPIRIVAERGYYFEPGEAEATGLAMTVYNDARTDVRQWKPANPLTLH